MYRGRSVAIVIPAYNEEGFVGDVIETVPDYVDRAFVVDDCSTDGTWREIRRHARRVDESASVAVADGGVQTDRRVVPIQHEENRGVGGAIKTGYERAREDEIEITAVMGGDGQMDPELLDRLLDPIVEDRADYVKGNRLLDAEDREEMPTFRLIGNGILSVLTKIASGYWKLGDPQNGYTAISLDALEAAPIEDMYEYYGYCNDLMVKLNAYELRVADVPVPSRYDDEESHISYREYIPKVSGMLLSNFIWRLRVKYLARDFNPLVFLYALGAAGSLAGIVRSLRNVASGGDDESRSSGLPIVLLGALSLVLAMIFDMQANEELEERDFE
ncbi:glycosyltransferase family 2 protein [Natronoarchaeum mannanilyticum]|uniref:glycosyltransferase family 2 protein n=1 Tax=Natronoarchaeum mannanilyticum TaxID=926360 RepID=UPI003612F2DE